jgi:acyl-coenzyme A thioesterase PaaI-like protein
MSHCLSFKKFIIRFQNTMTNVLKLYNKLKSLPFGKSIFGFAFCAYAPYFGTIFPSVVDLAPGKSVCSLNQSWIKQNHIKTVHAIAVCNLVEMSMGLVAESTIPKHLRWLPMGMNIDYLKKATGKLTATSEIDADTFFQLDKYPGMVSVPVVVKNMDDLVVTTAEVRLWISEKPKK